MLAPTIARRLFLVFVQRGGALVFVEFGFQLAGTFQAHLVGLAQGNFLLDLLAVLFDRDGALLLTLGTLGGQLGLILGLELLGAVNLVGDIGLADSAAGWTRRSTARSQRGR